MLTGESYRLVINKFMTMLQDGTLKQGDKIFSEHQLALSLGIPRTQVREVYTALSVLGILYGQQGRGTFLAQSDFHQNTEILYLMTLTAGSHFQEVLEVRRTLESEAVRLAARNRTVADLADLQQSVDVITSSRDPRVLTEADTSFHGTIAKASGNGLLHCLFQIVIGYMSRISLQHWTEVIQRAQTDRQTDYATQHRRLLEAIEAGDETEAENLMALHFTTLRSNYGIHESI